MIDACFFFTNSPQSFPSSSSEEVSWIMHKVCNLVFCCLQSLTHLFMLNTFNIGTSSTIPTNNGHRLNIYKGTQTLLRKISTHANIKVLIKTKDSVGKYEEKQKNISSMYYHWYGSFLRKLIKHNFKLVTTGLFLSSTHLVILCGCVSEEVSCKWRINFPVCHTFRILTSYHHLFCKGGREDDSATPLSPTCSWVSPAPLLFLPRIPSVIIVIIIHHQHM